MVIGHASRRARRVWRAAGRRLGAWGSGIALAAGLGTSSGAAAASVSPAPDRIVVVPPAPEPGSLAIESLGEWMAFSLTGALERAGVGRPVAHRSVLLIHRAASPGASADAMLQRLTALTGAGTVVTGSYHATADTIRVALYVNGYHLAGRACGLRLVGGSLRHLETIVRATLRERGNELARCIDEGYAGPVYAHAPPPTLAAYREYERAVARAAAGETDAAIRGFAEAARIDTAFLSAKVEALLLHWRRYDIPAVNALVAELHPRRERLSWREQVELAFARFEGLDDVESALEAARQHASMVPEDRYPLGLFALRANHLREALEALRSVPPESPLVSRSREHWSQLSRTLHMLGQHDMERQEALLASHRFPGEAGIAWYEVRALAGQGRPDLALVLLRRIAPLTAEAPPGHLRYWLLTAAELRAHRAPDSARAALAEAIRWAESRARSRPEGARARGVPQPLLAGLYYEAGRWSEAGRVYEALLRGARADAVWERMNHVARLACIAARTRGPDAVAVWERMLEDLRTADASVDAAINVRRATVAACLGDRDGAVEWLERNRERKPLTLGFGYGFGPWLHRDPDFAALRGHEPFERLVAPRD